MSLTLNETFRVGAHPDRVWRFLKNPAEVVTCLPGAELLETIDERTYGGRVKVKVGPITATYAGKATLTQVDDVARRMQIVGEGKESGGPGQARMTMTGVVTAHAEGGSEVSVDAAIDVAGRVMQFGRHLIEGVNKQLFRQFATSVRAKLEAAEAAEAAEGASASGVSVPSAGGAPADAAHGAPLGTAASVGEEGAVRTPAPTAVSGAPAPAVGRGAPAPAVAGGTPAPAPSSVVPPGPRPLAAPPRGEELRALPLLWKVLLEWLRGLFGRGR